MTTKDEIEPNLEISFEHDSCDCFLMSKKFNSNFDPSKLPLQRETIDLKFNFYKNLKDIRLKNKTNISQDEFRALKYFKNEKPFIVAECDKNVGIAFIPHTLYNSLALSHLNDDKLYLNLEENPLNSKSFIIKNCLENLLQNKDISKNLFKGLIIKDPKIGKFRLLPKLHKSKYSSRPIINCVSHPTSLICLLIDLVLQPFVFSCESYLKDSQNLIQKRLDLVFPSDSKLYSCDFESLYTNINLRHALVIISEFIAKNFVSYHLSSNGFFNLLKLVFENNIFSFNKKFYIQISGIAMGSKCGPSIANIYVYLLEKKFLTIHKPLFYVRFIDDIFVITKKEFEIDLLKRNFVPLKLNIDTNETVNFLDLNICLNYITGKLNFSLYIKPTNTFSYLLTTSNHPSFIFKNIPKSLFFRIRRICSFYDDYLYFSRLLISQLIQRGFNPDLVLKTARMVGNLDRLSLLPYKEKSNIFTKNNIFLKLPFNFNILNLSEILSFSLKNITLNNILLTLKLRLLNFMEPNLSSIMVHNFKLNLFEYFKYTKCLKINCSICPYINQSFYLNLNNFLLPLYSNSSCSSSNSVYIIYCRKCFCFYIGQTVKLKRRMRFHLKTIEFNRSFGSNCTSVYEHFNRSKHNINRDFSFLVFKTDLDTLQIRLSVEAQLIHLFRVLKIRILNEFLPNIANYKFLANLF